MEEKTGKSKTLRIVLGILMLLLSLAIFACFCLEIFCQKQLLSGSKSALFTDKTLDTSNKEIVTDKVTYHFSSWNIFSYFTQCSNLLVAVWAMVYGIALLCNAQKVTTFCEKPLIVTSITTYTVIAGLAVGFTIIFGMTQFQPYHNIWSVVVNTISITYHFVVPICMLLFCFFFKPTKKMQFKHTPYTLIFPLCYAVATFIRSTFIHPGFYPYFVFSPKNMWAIVGFGAEYNAPLAYLSIFVTMCLAAVLFWGAELLVAKIYNHNLQTNTIPQK